LDERDAFTPLGFERIPVDESRSRSGEFAARMAARRTVRHFAPDPVPFELIENAIRVAGSAPSGANQQPWHFVVVGDPEIKRRIRVAAEEEERINYESRFPDEWLAALAPLGTDCHKEFLEVAPYVIVVFQERFGVTVAPDGSTSQVKHYYVPESVGIAVGFLLAALHWSGLAMLTHTPSPMGFLSEILQRPANEKPYVVIPTGYPAPGARVPRLGKKPLEQILTHLGTAP
jgi:nitroreductase